MTEMVDACFMDNKNSNRIADVKTVLAHSLVFLLPFLTLISKSGVGACSFGFLLLAIWCYRDAGRSLRLHYAKVRGVLAAFVYGFLFAGLVIVLNSDFNLRYWEKPSRLLFAASAMLVVLALRPSRKALWYGLAAGAVAGASLAVYQRLLLGVERPGGDINPITFGDIVLCMGMMSLAGVLDFRGRQRFWPVLGAVAGLVGTLATGTRGGWVAIVLAVLLFSRYGRILPGKFAGRAAVIALAAMAVAYAVPQTGVQERVSQGVKDVREYYTGEYAHTNLGVRFELWKTGLMLAARRPFTPASQETVDRERAQLVAEGRVGPFVMEFDHFHNDALQAQVVGGLGGLLAYLLALCVPFLFFLRVLTAQGAAGGAAMAPALAGLMLVLGYFSFGLTEVIFWSVRSSMFYGLMLFVLVGMCVNAQQEVRQ
jgi:O-antigen ligase